MVKTANYDRRLRVFESGEFEREEKETPQPRSWSGPPGRADLYRERLEKGLDIYSGEPLEDDPIEKKVLSECIRFKKSDRKKFPLNDFSAKNNISVSEVLEVKYALMRKGKINNNWEILF